jgi:hypothetical protein
VSHTENDGVSVDRLSGISIPGVRRLTVLDGSSGPKHFDDQGLLGVVIRREEPVRCIEALAYKAPLGDIDSSTMVFHFLDDNRERFLGLVQRTDQFFHERSKWRLIRWVWPIDEAINTVSLVWARVLFFIRSSEKTIVVKSLHGNLRIYQDVKESLCVVGVAVGSNDSVEVNVIVWFIQTVLVPDEFVSVVGLPSINQDASVLRSLDEDPIALTNVDKEDFEMAIPCQIRRFDVSFPPRDTEREPGMLLKFAHP